MQEKSKMSLDVLFVEDSAVDVELTVIELERDDFAVSWVQVDTEFSLRESLQASRPEIVISDYSMPRFDGVAALRIVREMSPHLPFIFLSGTIGEERAIESIREGATDYVLKSNMRRLPMAVRRALSDARERERARIAEEARARMAAILEATSDCVAICDPRGALIYLNSAGQSLTGLSNGTLADRTIFSLHPESSREVVVAEGWPGAIESGLWEGETTLLAADGTEVPMSQVIIAHRRTDGEIDYFSTIARDIRERKAYEERITYLANYDALTGLPNRELLGDRAAQAMSFRRYEDRSLALLVIDIDRFKLVNDGYGQAAGDELLRMLSDRLLSTVRDGDTVARLGADSFAILATDLARPDDALTIARKIQAATTTPYLIDGREVRLTVSIGASAFPRDGNDVDSLLRNANAAMHRVKSEGQNGFQFYAANMTRDAADKVELENALRAALDRGELALHYQPQIHLESGRIVGVEALMRWNHPERGSVSPGIFIPIAEHTDLIHLLGKWAFMEACGQLKRWGGDAAVLRMAVNVSARQFRGPELTKIIERALSASGVQPQLLELELTESVLVEDPEDASQKLNRLKELGVKLAIDDFGTGYSSLSYLSRLPIDCLKIDREFLDRIPGKHYDTAIVQAIISLARSLELDVIAEGIETREQLSFLRDHGCPEGQGFLFARPVPPDSMEALLRRGNRF
ncbi:MAG: EAL domain-containing protein [Arenicellales bacterium]